jgi:hypothetical protein
MAAPAISPLAAYCIACTNAVACTPSSERGIVFERVPTDIDAPVVIEVTIYDQTQVGDAARNQMVLMNARVDRVIKGSLDGALRFWTKTYSGSWVYPWISHPYETPKVSLLLNFKRDQRSHLAWVHCVFEKSRTRASRHSWHC